MHAMASRYLATINGAELTRRIGKVLDFNGLVIEANGPDVFLGELCEVYPRRVSTPVPAEVVGFRNGRVLLMPYGNTHGIALESDIVAQGRTLGIPVGDNLLGRVIDAFSRPLDGGPVPRYADEYPLHREPINPLEREPITKILETGVRAIDGLLALGKGQRTGIFAGSGVGKSTLLGMLARNVKADVNVIAMIGERGREVWDFINDSLGKNGLARSVVVVATADQPALVRTHAVHAATAIAEHFRDQGKDVLMIMDSITRFAMAQREIGLAIGELPASRGYTPSVFGILPQILERGGRLRNSGSVTAIYSVLVEGDDMNDPVADHMRALLDGHIVLSRELANRGHYPAIDVPQSVSRLMPKLVNDDTARDARRILELISRYESSRDLIDMGAYKEGANSKLDEAVRSMPDIDNLLCQTTMEISKREEALRAMNRLVSKSKAA